MQNPWERRVSPTQAGLGSIVCLASSFGAHAAATEDAGASDLKEIVVTGHPSIDIFASSFQGTPQNVTVVSQQALSDQAISNLQDALKNVPGITLNAGEGGTHGDNINLRGFAASDDFFLDGLRDTGFYTRDSFNLDSVEVYKGPASTLFGRGSTGGVINQVSKSPEFARFIRGTVAGGTNNQLRVTADVNYAFGDAAAFRMNAVGHRAAVADRDFVDNQRWGVAPALSLGLGTATSLKLQYLHQRQDDIPDYGVPFAFGKPVPVPRNTYYGLPSDDRSRARVDVGTAVFKTQFNQHVWLTDTARIGNYFFDSRETAAHYGSPPSMPLGDVLIFRDRPSAEGTVSTLMNDANLHFWFSTGLVQQHLILGIELDREQADLTRFANQLNQIPGTPILDPDPFEPFPGHQTQVTQTPDTVTRTTSALVQEILDFGPNWQATAGLRVDRFNAEFNEPLTKARFAHTDTIGNPRVSLVYKPLPAVSIYGSYGTSYDPSAENLSLSAKTASLGPEKDRTCEFGVKVVALNGKLALQSGLFQTGMINARVGDPTNPSAPQILAGAERVRGLETDAIGYLSDELEITAGYTHLASKTLKSTDPGSVGAPLLNTAPNQANLWLVYEYQEAWKAGSGINYLDRRAADNNDTAHVPAYITYDAVLRYRINSAFAVQLNAYNLTNRYYYANSYFSSPVENHVVPGGGRTALLTVSFSY